MILIGQFDSPFVRRVAVTLHCYGISYERNPLSVFGDMDKMRGINPLVRVPALILEDGETLIDSGVIIDHLDEMAGPARALIPAAGPERRKILRTVALASGAMEKTMATFFERYFHDGETISRPYEKRLLSQLTATLEYLETQCGAPWFDGKQMTQSDVSITCLIAYIKMRVADAWPAGSYPKLNALAEYCEALDVFIRARAASDEVVPART